MPDSERAITQSRPDALAEAQLRIAELEQALITAQATSQREAQAVVARDALIASISRELSNQLAPVTLATERLRALVPGGDPQKITAGLDLIERACAAFARRCRSLLEFSELAGRSTQLAPQPVDLSQLLREAIDRHADIARRAGCALCLSIAEGIVVSAEPAGLQAVLENLLANAFKFGAGHTVHVGVREAPGNRAVLSVRDEGPGVSREIASAVFGPFQYPRPPGAPGLGIGLWMSAQWAAAMGGALRLINPDAPGPCFEVELTRAKMPPNFPQSGKAG